MSIDLTKLSNEILSIQGITTFYTYRPDLGGTYVEGLSLMIWNPVYEDDILQTTQNYNLPIFKFPFFRDVDNIGDKIQVFRASDANSILSTTLSINTDVNSSDMIGLN